MFGGTYIVDYPLMIVNTFRKFRGWERLIYDEVCRLCLERDMTISALEKKLNLGNATIRGWKESEPRVGTLKLVADFFGVSVDSLIAGNPSDELRSVPEMTKEEEERADRQGQAWLDSIRGGDKDDA